MKGERGGIAETASLPPAVDRACSTRRVFQNLDLIGQGSSQCVDIGRQTEQMHRDHKLGLVRHPPDSVFDIDVEGPRVDVTENRPRAAILNDIGGGYPGEARDNDLITRPDLHCRKRQMQRGRATRGGERMVHVMQLGERLLECSDLGPLGQPAGLKHLGDSRCLFRAHARLGDLDRSFGETIAH